MEKRIKAYEKYIKSLTARKMTVAERVELAEYHREMLTNFQRERLIHLIITLFFSAVSLAIIGVLVWSILALGFAVEMTAFYILVIIIISLTVAYIKHYYFLENHIQGLYDYTKKLMTKED